jgi:hypothetical protein
MLENNPIVIFLFFEGVVGQFQRIKIKKFYFSEADPQMFVATILALTTNGTMLT